MMNDEKKNKIIEKVNNINDQSKSNTFKNKNLISIKSETEKILGIDEFIKRKHHIKIEKSFNELFKIEDVENSISFSDKNFLRKKTYDGIEIKLIDEESFNEFKEYIKYDLFSIYNNLKSKEERMNF